MFQQKMEEAGRKFDPSKCLLVVDDWKLPIGKAVFRLRGGHDSSYFLQEASQAMDITEMPRLRVGIGSKQVLHAHLHAGCPSDRARVCVSVV